jgi:hypothetical protein
VDTECDEHPPGEATLRELLRRTSHLLGADDASRHDRAQDFIVSPNNKTKAAREPSARVLREPLKGHTERGFGGLPFATLGVLRRLIKRAEGGLRAP